ncbi:hypothetical protein [Halobacterium bonnevillei]|uniref:Uncharacterized protein n=1 Tax=Halobacterium bonnevillei TaxID=2692200 RepID=A0A6B0SBM0_9EURY|nr:hypothetical protein [Halobacterium bonnevillei]MXR19104.1 hypothetical protein [Halobacterium bonnevillei]
MSEGVGDAVAVAGDVLRRELRTVRNSGFEGELVKLFGERCLVVAGQGGGLLESCFSGESYFQQLWHGSRERISAVNKGLSWLTEIDGPMAVSVRDSE